MRIALVPMEVDPINMDANVESVGRWVKALHETVQIIVFPRIVISSLLKDDPDTGRGLLAHKYADLMCVFAQSRKVCLATEFLESKNDQGLRMAMVADRMGQMDAQSRHLQPDATSSSGSLFITARISRERIALASLDDLEKQRLPIEANLAKIKAIVVPLNFGGSPPEIRRVAVHNPPAALEDLKERFSQVARLARVHVLVANALGEDSDRACGPCGGTFVFDPSGKEIQSTQILDPTHIEFELP